MKKRKSITSVVMSLMLAVSLAACSSADQTVQNETSTEITEEIQTDEDTVETENTETIIETGETAIETEKAASEEESESSSQDASGNHITAEDIAVNETIENTADGEHAITADGESAEYSGIKVVKSGDSEGDEADFYGENAAVFATNGAVLDLSGVLVDTDGTHANGVFSYGEGTVVNISGSLIETTGNCSGGIMTTGGGTMNAQNLTIHTTGNSSAAIRSDRGGGVVTVNGGSYTTDGTGSPVIYSTADITVSDADMESTASQGIVVEGKNSVTLNNVDLTADNNTHNSDKSDHYQAVMIYQSMSGDADEGLASFAMNGGTLTNKNGDIFFVNNTNATIDLSKANILNQGDGVFLRAAAAGWGSEGSNGGNVTLNASSQTIDGDMLVDDISTLNLYLADGSSFTGSIDPDGQAGEVYVEITDGSIWTLTGDSYITSLTCDADSIDLNGYTLYVNGEAYAEGTAVTGEAVEATITSSGQKPDMMPGDSQAPDGQAGPGGNPPDGQPPEKPDGQAPDGQGGPGGNPPDGQPPEMTDGQTESE